MIANWFRDTFESLGNRDYRVLWFGTTLAFLCFMMSSVVQAVVAFDLTGKNRAVGAVSLGMGVASILISPFGGVIADRVSRRRLLLIGQTIVGVNFLAVGVLIVTDQISVPLLIASTFVLGAVFSFIGPARQAWIGEILPGPALANGIAVQQIAMTLTRIFGPFVAGGLVALSFVGTGGTYLFMGAAFAVVIATLARLPASTVVREGPPRSVSDDFLSGFRYIGGTPTLALLSLTFIGVVITGFSYQVLLPGFLENELGRNPRDMSWLLGIGAAAGLIVTLGLARLAGSRHAWWLMFTGAAVLGLSLALTALAQTFAQALIAMLFVGAGASGFQLLNNALVMQEAEPAYYGRVMSITMLAWGLNGLAGLPFGVLADRAGERQALLAMGLLVLAVALAAIAARAGLPRAAVPAPVTPSGGE